MDDGAESAVGSRVSTWGPFSLLSAKSRDQKGKELKGSCSVCLKGYS